MSLKQEYLGRYSGDPIEAAAAMARDLNRGAPSPFQAVYPPESAILAVQDNFPEVSAEAIRKINGWDAEALEEAQAIEDFEAIADLDNGGGQIPTVMGCQHWFMWDGRCYYCGGSK